MFQDHLDVGLAPQSHQQQQKRPKEFYEKVTRRRRHEGTERTFKRTAWLSAEDAVPSPISLWFILNVYQIEYQGWEPN